MVKSIFFNVIVHAADTLDHARRLMFIDLLHYLVIKDALDILIRTNGILKRGFDSWCYVI